MDHVEADRMGEVEAEGRMIAENSTHGFFPLASFEDIPLDLANQLLAQWGHKMGPLLRGNSGSKGCHALFVHGKPVALTTMSSLIRERVGGLPHLTRDNTIELSRLCASNSWSCRVVLRLWREVIFPSCGYQFAVSYQDADLHSGNIYRFDGWQRAAFSRSGIDQRSGRNGRNKWVWIWPRLVP